MLSTILLSTTIYIVNVLVFNLKTLVTVSFGLSPRLVRGHVVLNLIPPVPIIYLYILNNVIILKKLAQYY